MKERKKLTQEEFMKLPIGTNFHVSYDKMMVFMSDKDDLSSKTTSLEPISTGKILHDKLTVMRSREYSTTICSQGIMIKLTT